MPLTSLTFQCTSDPVEAKAWFAGLIADEPVLMSVIASVADSVIADRARYEDPRWWAGRDASGRVVAGFMRTPPWPLHVAMATAGQAAAFAEHLARQGSSLPGVGGRREPTEAFRDVWAKLTGVSPRTVMEVGAFDLPDRPALPFPVTGHYRLARRDELAVADRWAQDFNAAVEHTPGKAHSLVHRIGAGRVGFWVDEGHPVSMAHASLVNGGVTRISGVWTPVELRGRGYASAVVAALSSERMDAGESCMLFTDLANPTSNKIYQAMGYRRIGDNITIEFLGPVATR
jgi:predicted GNAT family acetyltransferase